MKQEPAPGKPLRVPCPSAEICWYTSASVRGCRNQKHISEHTASLPTVTYLSNEPWRCCPCASSHPQLRLIFRGCRLPAKSLSLQRLAPTPATAPRASPGEEPGEAARPAHRSTGSSRGSAELSLNRTVTSLRL